MQQHDSIESQINTYFQNSGELSSGESDVLMKITAELMAAQGFVTNKALILKLLNKMEMETDVVKLDIYRSVLEEIVHRTPDDVIA